MDGHQVMEMRDAAPKGELFVTATGCCRVIRGEHFELMQDGATLANVGHSDSEIAIDQLRSAAAESTEKGEGITRYTLPDGTELDLLAEGSLVNLTGPYSQGHPVEVMDSTFATMFVAGRELVRNFSDYGAGVHKLPQCIDEEVAEKKLASLGLKIDSLDEFQKEYLGSWDRENVLGR